MKKEFMFQINGEVQCILLEMRSMDEIMEKLIWHFKTKDIVFLGLCEA